MRAIIFDMDGVLVLTADAHFRSWQDASRRNGVEVDYDKFIRTFGRTNPDIIRLWWGEDATPELIHAIADEKERAFRDIIRDEVPLAPGTVELLQDLRSAGFRIAVGSSAPPENIDLVLDAGGIREYFTATVDGSMVKRGKPAPDVFLMAAERLGVAPVNAAVIEDAPAGIMAAVAAGTAAVGVAATHSAEELRAAGAHFITPALSDLNARILAEHIKSRG